MIFSRSACCAALVLLLCLTSYSVTQASGRHQPVYGAIAIAPSTMTSVATNGEFTRERAEKIVMERCQLSDDKPKDCAIAVWFYDSCGSLATKHSEPWAWGADWGNSISSAESKALATCQKQSNGEACKIEMSVCTKNFD